MIGTSVGRKKPDPVVTKAAEERLFNNQFARLWLPGCRQRRQRRQRPHRQREPSPRQTFLRNLLDRDNSRRYRQRQSRRMIKAKKGL